MSCIRQAQHASECSKSCYRHQQRPFVSHLASPYREFRDVKVFEFGIVAWFQKFSQSVNYYKTKSQF